MLVSVHQTKYSILSHPLHEADEGSMLHWCCQDSLLFVAHLEEPQSALHRPVKTCKDIKDTIITLSTATIECITCQATHSSA